MLIKKLIPMLCLLAALQAGAQDSLLLRDYTVVKQDDPWVTAQNAAALTRFSHRNIMQAAMTVGGGKGGFVNYDESDDATTVDVSAESFYRFSPATVFFGAISYQNFSGRHMGGSAFINPERKPFDLVEDSLTNTGTKHRDTYRLSGGVGCKLTEQLALGAKVDYTAANYAKYKDLRHQNKLMDLILTAGVYAPLTDWLQLGANYRYHRNTESVLFGTYGTSDKVYKTLVSHAAFMGEVEQFGSEGYTDKSREMPLVTDISGFEVQIGSRWQGFSLFAAYGYDHGRGYYGRKSPYTITYTEHTTDAHHLQLQIACRHGSSKHELNFSTAYEALENEATTHSERQNTSGATYYEYFTPVKTADKRWRNGHADYHLLLGLNGEMASWELRAALDWMKRRQTAYRYPFYRTQDISNMEGQLSITHNMITKKGVWTVALKSGFQKGSGNPYEDMTYQTPSDKQPVPATMETCLQREYLYLTAPQISAGISVRYAFVLKSWPVRPFIGIALSQRKANSYSDCLIGRHHTQGAVSVGCTL